MALAEHRARFYDGQTAVGRDVAVRLVAGTIEILAADRRLIARWPLAKVTAQGSLGDDAAVTLSCGTSPEARLRLDDADAVARLLERLPKTAKTDRFDAKRVAGWSGVGLAVLGLAAFAVHSLPELAAPLLPFETKRAIGEAVARSMFPPDKHCDSTARLAPLEALAEELRLAAGIEHPIHLIVVDYELVNAFATPGGVVVITRGLIEDADDPDEVAGVLAHELGHVQHEHPTQGMLRNLGISALLQFLTGGTDLEGLANAGGILAFLSYSRAAEEEADRTAIEMLDATGINADGLSRFFTRLEEEEEASGIADLIPGWLSTHPPTTARREATARAATGIVALSDVDWQALQSVCTGDNDPDGKARAGKQRGDTSAD
jgi:Zn-dependent protease with chaperone function